MPIPASERRKLRVGQIGRARSAFFKVATNDTPPRMEPIFELNIPSESEATPPSALKRFGKLKQQTGTI